MKVWKLLIRVSFPSHIRLSSRVPFNFLFDIQVQSLSFWFSDISRTWQKKVNFGRKKKVKIPFLLFHQLGRGGLNSCPDTCVCVCVCMRLCVKMLSSQGVYFSVHRSCKNLLLPVCASKPFLFFQAVKTAHLSYCLPLSVGVKSEIDQGVLKERCAAQVI